MTFLSTLHFQDELKVSFNCIRMIANAHGSCKQIISLITLSLVCFESQRLSPLELSANVK